MKDYPKGRLHRLLAAEAVLKKNGIYDSKAVLKEIGLALLERDVYSTSFDNRQDICTALRDVLALTSNAGDPRSNALEALIYLPEKETVRPVFEGGAGSSGYYDINVAGDSGTAVIEDIVKKFVGRVW